MSERPFRDADLLNELYLKQNLSTREIADRLNCDKQTILYWMKKQGIARRSYPESQKNFVEVKGHPPGGGFNKAHQINMGRKTPEVTRRKLSLAQKRSWKRRKKEQRHRKAILREYQKLREQGFRCLIVDDLRPDIIAVNDHKICAVEIELGLIQSKDYQRYEGNDFFDEVFWIRP